MKNNDWFKHEKKGFFKDSPKTKSKDEFTPEKALKTAGGLVLVGVGTAVALDLIGDL